jgi:hypothetical protein
MICRCICSSPKYAFSLPEPLCNPPSRIASQLFWMNPVALLIYLRKCQRPLASYLLRPRHRPSHVLLKYILLKTSDFFVD